MNFVQLLREGKVIGMPTETVYGLAGDARNDRAVSTIFSLKKRPKTSPLIIHVAGTEEATLYGVLRPDARKLAEAFWRSGGGALTLVLPARKDARLSPLVRGGFDSIAIRVPHHPMALALLRDFDGPIAAPSANLHQSLSPTCAAHVQTMFPDLPVLDGGSCVVGLESTIVDCTSETLRILRYGGITQKRIEEVLDKTVASVDETILKAPGMGRHYAPRTPIRMDATTRHEGEFLLGFGDVVCDLNLSASGNLEEAAHNLFDYLHRLDAQGHACIAVTPIPHQGLGIAINDRLTRACL